MKRYELLEDIVHLYFGQDYDYFGETGAEIMASLRETWNADEVQALRTQILDFMRSHPDLETDFPRRFGLHAQMEDFGSTEREFLDHVLAALK